MPVRLDFYEELTKIREIGLEKELLDELRTLALSEDESEYKHECKCHRCKQNSLSIRIELVLDKKEKGENEIAEISAKSQWVKCTAIFHFTCATCVDKFPLTLYGHYFNKEHKEMYKVPPNYLDRILVNL